MSRVYFTDRDIGKKFPGILAEAGLTVERHHDLFPPDGSDEQWLEHCGTNDRVAISHNERIRYTPNELAAVRRHRVTLLIVVGHAPFAELARNFVNTLPKIAAFLGEHEPPYIAKVVPACAGGAGSKSDGTRNDHAVVSGLTSARRVGSLHAAKGSDVPIFLGFFDTLWRHVDGVDILRLARTASRAEPQARASI